RAEFPEIARLGYAAASETMNRIDLAYQHFFRRVREGGGPAGFPKFKSLRQYPGWTLRIGNGCRIEFSPTGEKARLSILHVGTLRMRGGARTVGSPVTCDILHKDERWYASVTMLCNPERSCGGGVAGLHWGVEKMATLATPDGETKEIKNPG